MKSVERKEMYKHLANIHIAGFGYWDGCEAFSSLKIGTKLELEREEDNKFDPFAVAIYYKDQKLGFIPREMNENISKMLDMGWGEIFEVIVNRVTPDARPEGQIEVAIRIKRKAHNPS